MKRLSGSRGVYLGWSFSEELLRLGGLFGLLLLENFIFDSSLHVRTLERFKFGNCGGCNDVVLLDSSDWDTVKLEWTSDSKETRFELLEENNSLSSESTGKEDENLTRLDVRSKLRSFWLMSVGSGVSIFSWIPLGGLLNHCDVCKINNKK